jgi:hypothetical protein
MFGIDIDQIDLQPVEIDGDVYVPLHTGEGGPGPEMTTYVKYEVIADQFPDGDDVFDTDDFRIK